MSEETQTETISQRFAELVQSSTTQAAELYESGNTDGAVIELLSTLNSGLAALVMLQEGQLHATAHLINLGEEEKAERHAF